MIEFTLYILVRLMMSLINLFPITVSVWISRRIGEVMFLLMSSRRRIARQNLDLAFDASRSDLEKERLALESFRHLATATMEFFRLPKFAKTSSAHVHFKGTEHLDRAFARGKGVILAMSHLGPWEYLGFLTYLKKYPTTVLGRPVKNPYFYRWIKGLRKKVNLNYRDKTMGTRELFSRLRQNHLVAITIDQWAGNEGIWINFFGQPTSTTSLPARLAKRTDAALIPAYCVRLTCGEYEICVQEEVAVAEDAGDWTECMTQKLNSLLEQQIRTFPEQWLWTHKRWKAK